MRCSLQSGRDLADQDDRRKRERGEERRAVLAVVEERQVVREAGEDGRVDAIPTCE